MTFDDSDIKIMPDDPSEVFDMSEGAANAFVRETNNGNMEKAKKLGAQFAAGLIDPNCVCVFGVGELDTVNTISQRKVLFAYVVNQVIEEMAPNSIVAQSALSSFYDAVQQQDAKTYELINDSAAFTMYILQARLVPNDGQGMGEVFAKLCGQEGQRLYINYGKELYNYFTITCTEQVLAADMIR
ncbi:hypothetical protein [Youxingia wuxianensis]|uniref:Uncharacterized protein n=1 Tax=Youxingia wuxianensis TaxID=2763678 RepID=A0A926IHS5_9FIRM|nr:hypothetical protein [Youxingia wuxianensis]MBC8584983.1 hypothetical protein [Youxingia wuxianensis]